MNGSTKCVLYTCTCVLVGVVAVLGIVQIIKYTEGHTTYSEKEERHDFLRFPHMSFCPGYKSLPESFLWAPQMMLSLLDLTGQNRQQHGGPVRSAATNSTSAPFSEERLEELWLATTFDLEEVVVAVVISEMDLLEMQVYRPGDDDDDPAPPGCLEVTEHDTVLGRCYTLGFPCSAERKTDSVIVDLNASAAAKGSLSLHLHDEAADANLGLNYNYWRLPVSSDRFLPDQFVEVGITKHLKRYYEGASTGEHIDCTRAKYQVWLAEAVEGKDDFCMLPAFSSIFDYLSPRSIRDRSKIDPCATQGDARRAMQTVVDFLNSLGRHSRCPGPQEEVTYRTSKMEVAVLPEQTAGLTEVYLYFASSDVRVAEEYALLDLGILLSSLGGTIGMFLGWSALDLVRAACRNLGSCLGGVAGSQTNFPSAASRRKRSIYAN